MTELWDGMTELWEGMTEFVRSNDTVWGWNDRICDENGRMWRVATCRE
jgi:hypothetical protein